MYMSKIYDALVVTKPVLSVVLPVYVVPVCKVLRETLHVTNVTTYSSKVLHTSIHSSERYVQLYILKCYCNFVTVKHLTIRLH